MTVSMLPSHVETVDILFHELVESVEKHQVEMNLLNNSIEVLDTSWEMG